MEFLDFLEQLRPAFKAVVLPPGGLLLLLLLGLLLGRRALGRTLAWLALLGLYLMSTSAATHWLAQHLETYPAKSAAQLLQTQAQAILVLAAGHNGDNPELDGQPTPSKLGLQRLDYALRLHQLTKLPIVISGGKPNFKDDPLADIYARWLNERAGVEALALETRSATTWENLEYSADLLKELGLQRVILVTHAFHMPRAMFAAREHGVDAVAAPFGYLGSKPARPTDYENNSTWTPSAYQFGPNYLLLHELLGALWYQLRT